MAGDRGKKFKAKARRRHWSLNRAETNGTNGEEEGAGAGPNGINTPREEGPSEGSLSNQPEAGLVLLGKTTNHKFVHMNGQPGIPRWWYGEFQLSHPDAMMSYLAIYICKYLVQRLARRKSVVTPSREERRPLRVPKSLQDRLDRHPWSKRLHLLIVCFLLISALHFAVYMEPPLKSNKKRGKKAVLSGSKRVVGSRKS
ncbi:uncharacterized protein LOC101861584 [Aplysia californica]|uniref:Uncharacterized protein LOC101861584 n=1 Tax=Aplysia californica TaxID=6500 RepID=A0ABM1VU03_APLCA|nr:uncharacterized protein LOC101861584 [Aplysia californica]XP_035825895.1 uncharacterized protein LOC101861584 [Aplysia californica]